MYKAVIICTVLRKFSCSIWLWLSCICLFSHNEICIFTERCICVTDNSIFICVFIYISIGEREEKHDKSQNHKGMFHELIISLKALPVNLFKRSGKVILT